MDFARSLVSGTAGAVFLNALHESARQVIPDAPRMDLIGMRVLERPLRKAGYVSISRSKLRRATLVGDIVSNALYYAWAVSGPYAWDRASRLRRAAAFGLVAGLGGALLPPVLGLGHQPSTRPLRTGALTVAWYLAGALAAESVAELLRDTERTPEHALESPGDWPGYGIA